MRKSPLIIGHRGCRYPGIPENSSAAVERAVQEDADIVEMDIVTTKDGVFVAFHYSPLAPRGAHLRRRTVSELAHVETMESLLGVLASRKAVYLDIKEKLSTEQLATLRSIVQAMHRNDVIVGSFHTSVLTACQALAPHWTINLHCFATMSAVRRAASLGAHWINPMPFLVTESFVRCAQAHDLKFVPAGNENDAKQLRYAELGAYALSTFRPARLRRLVGKCDCCGSPEEQDTDD